MYRSTEMCKSNEHLYDSDVSFSDKWQNVTMRRYFRELYFQHLFINQLGISSKSIPLLGVPILKHCISKIRIPKLIIPMLPLFLVSYVHPPVGTIIPSIQISANLGVCSLARYAHFSFIVPLNSRFYLKVNFFNLNLSQFQKRSRCQ